MEDTYKGQVDNPLTLNRYTYVSNNPLKYVDPTGNVQEIHADWAPGNGTVYKTANDLTLPEALIFSVDPNISAEQRAIAQAIVWKLILAPDKGGTIVATNTAKQVKIPKVVNQQNVKVHGPPVPQKTFKVDLQFFGMKFVDVSNRMGWVNIGNKDSFIRTNKYTLGTVRKEDLTDNIKTPVYDKNKKLIGEIHSFQPEYNYNRPGRPPTGKFFPEHLHRLDSDGELSSIHEYFD
ncbi:hypothetical protein [Brevibacillus brevis]|uniref:hypothetical protein n=1 Tax=Brevibacillus brevis TaxID=1393 RepID=UPI00165D4352|nr:hypothetical protein [Brevibacillus brevis]